MVCRCRARVLGPPKRMLANGSVALQAAGGVDTVAFAGELPSQGAQRGVHRVGRVGGHDGDGDAVGQQRVQALK